MEAKLAFSAWLAELKAAFVAKSAMTEEEAHNYVFDNTNDWRDYYNDDFSPKNAADEDMGYWE